jgi:hypothetical protein
VDGVFSHDPVGARTAGEAAMIGIARGAGSYSAALAQRFRSETLDENTLAQTCAEAP